MKANDKSIEGIFKYSDDLTYEVNDFVIQEGGLYVCLQESVGNKPSDNPEYFKPYLGDKCISVQEYLDEVEDAEEGEDKYISAAILPGILNYYMSGFSKKGEITNTIDILDSGTYSLRGDITLENPLRTREELLDYLLNLETLNNGIFKISPGVFSETDGEAFPRILRQYTYFQGSSRYRVQELINLNTGGVEYRVGDSDGKISIWKSISDNVDINNDIEKIERYYREELEVFNDALTELQNCFRWKRANPTDSGGVSVSLPLNCIYTAVISWMENGMRRCESVTTTKVGENEGTSETIFVAPGIYLSIYASPLLENRCNISVGGSGTDLTLECVYYSEYYTKPS